MRLIFTENTRRFCRDSWDLPFHVALVFAVCLTACNNTCFTFNSNPPTGTINIKASNPPPVCSLTKVTSAVRLLVQTVPPCTSCSESVRFQHVFVGIRGIDIHASSTADDNSPDWQELTPQFAKQPLRVDLMRDGADQGTRESLSEIAAIPAGAYRQVRVRFAAALSSKDEVAGQIACGGTSLNCAVMGDGTIRPILLDVASPVLHITPERIKGGFLLIFPDIENNLVLEMKPIWTWFAPANSRDIGLRPMLTANAWFERGAPDEVGTSADAVDQLSSPRVR